MAERKRNSTAVMSRRHPVAPDAPLLEARAGGGLT